MTRVVIHPDAAALASADAAHMRTALLDGSDPAPTRCARLTHKGLTLVFADYGTTSVTAFDGALVPAAFSATTVSE